jgi:two-component system, OmpR family, sensor kinase
MTAIGSLKGRIALGAGGLFFLLYAVASALVLIIDTRNTRGQLEVLLYAQAETLASYYASSHRLDYPELATVEKETPFPVWMRVIRQGKVIAATPGLPDLGTVRRAKQDFGRLEILTSRNGRPLAVVAHEIWNEPGTEVEAISSFHLLTQRRRDLLFALGSASLLLIPLAALAGRLLAARALKPVDTLVESISALGFDRLDQRLAAPGAVTEIASLTDEFNRLLDRLQQSVEAMRRFTADASHELRTPISILRTGLEVTLRKERTGEEYRELLQENLEEIERVQRIVEALLTLARHGDAREIRHETVDFSSVVEAALVSIRPPASEKSLILETRTAPGVHLQGDPDQLRLMVLNLLDNAVKFTPPGRRIRTLLEAQLGHARLEVHDEGPGVAAADRPYLFDRFYRSQTTRPNGSVTGGLGLSLARWVAERHGGEVRLLETDEPGATFEVTLPRT